MINKEHGEELEQRKKRKMRNQYADLWSFVFVAAYLIFCKYNFNTFNPFTSTWAYIRIGQGKAVEFKLNDHTNMIKQSYRKSFINVLKNDLEKDGFTLIEEQTHEIKFDKGGVEFIYKVDERNLFGIRYSLVIMEEEEQEVVIK